MENQSYEMGMLSPLVNSRDANDIRQRGSKAIAKGEAADLYGDVQTAQRYGYVDRG